MPTRNSGFFVQHSGVADLLVPLAEPALGVAHHALDPAVDPPSWRCVGVFGAELGGVQSVSLIRSNFGDPGNLEAVARAGERLAAFWRGCEPGARWSEPYLLSLGVAGDPALIQGRWGYRGCFELCAPLARGGLGHWYRDNDTAGLPWHGPAVLGEAIGRFEAVALAHSSAGEAGYLELVARAGERLLHFRCGQDRVWRGPQEVVSGVTGRPALLVGSGGQYELCAPLAAAGVGHWRRESDDPAAPWRGPQIFGTELGRCEQVSLVAREDGRLEAAVIAGGRAAHFVREGGGWSRRATFSVGPAPASPQAQAQPSPQPQPQRQPEPQPQRQPEPQPQRQPEPQPQPQRQPEPQRQPQPQGQPEPEPQPQRQPQPPPAPAPAARPRRVPRPGASPLAKGPHGAGFRRIADLELSEDARYPDARPFEGHIYKSPERAAALLYYPAAADGEDAPIAPGAPFPVIAMAHARRLRSAGAEDVAQDYRQLSGLQAHLARRGFVVIAPDLSWLTPDDGAARRASALRDALAHLRAGSRGPILADFERAGLIGHGLGGLAAITLAIDRGCPFHIRAVALLSPPSAGASAPELEGLPPSLVLRGSAEPDSGAAALHAASPVPRHLVTLPGGGISGYTTSITEPGGEDGGMERMSRRDQQRTARAYVAAFFEHYLRGEDHLAWLCGDAPVPELAPLGVEVLGEVP